MDYDSLIELAKKRRSYWEFRADPVSDDDIVKIVDAARYAPSGFNSQPWEFVVIKEPDLKEEIIRFVAEHMPPRPAMPPGPAAQEPQRPRKDPLGFKTAPVFIILFGDPRVRDYCPPGMKTDDKRWQQTFISSLAIAYQYMHLAAASLGLATKWVSAVSAPAVETKLKELLGIPHDFVTYDLMALGYSDFQPPPKKLRALDEMLHRGRCSVDDFRTDEQVRAYFPRR